MCLALRLCAREAQGVDVLRAIAVATCVAASKHVGIAALQGEGDRKHEAPLGARAAPIVVRSCTCSPSVMITDLCLRQVRLIMRSSFIPCMNDLGINIEHVNTVYGKGMSPSDILSIEALS